MIRSYYKDQFSFEQREKECKDILKKHNDKIALIIELSPTASSITPYIPKRKFLASPDMNFYEFLIVVRNRFDLNHTQSILFFVNDTILITNTMKISELYHQYRDHDGFVYLKYTTENTFG